MGFNFRKSLKVAPDIRLNISEKGLTSVSVGKKGATVNLKKSKIKSTFGIPKTGLSYSKEFEMQKSINSRPLPLVNNSTHKSVSILLGIGIFLMPYFFAWLTLREGHSNFSRALSFGWMILLIFISK